MSHIAPLPSAISLIDLLRGFQSLGDNCEFGMVQRAAGLEQTSLFRLAYVPMPEMLRLLQDQMRLMLRDDLLTFKQAGDDLLVGLRDHHLYYHKPHELDVTGDPRQTEASRLSYLRQKMLRDLASATQIFVRKTQADQPQAEVEQLVQVLRRFGPNQLLWVVPADDCHAPGSVERIGPHLMKGYIDRTAPYSEAHDVSFDMWIELCIACRRLARGDEPPLETGRANRIAAITHPIGADWVDPAELRPMRAGDPVFAHTIANADDTHLTRCDFGLATTGPMVASTWVMIPQGSGVRSVISFVDGQAATRAAPADIHRRGVWQLVWASATMPQGRDTAAGLWIKGDPGSVVYSTDWTVHPGQHPTGYIRLPHRPSPRPQAAKA